MKALFHCPNCESNNLPQEVNTGFVEVAPIIRFGDDGDPKYGSIYYSNENEIQGQKAFECSACGLILQNAGQDTPISNWASLRIYIQTHPPKVNGRN